MKKYIPNKIEKKWQKIWEQKKIFEAKNPSTRSARSGQVFSTSNGKCTGVYFDPATVGSLTLAINKFLDLEKKDYFDPKFIRRHAQKFGKERFKREILKFVEKCLR